MDEDTLRRILGEFATGIMERFDRVEREISGIYATIEKVEEKAGQRFDAIEKRLGNIEVQLEVCQDETYGARRGDFSLAARDSGLGPATGITCWARRRPSEVRLGVGWLSYHYPSSKGASAGDS